jgi:dTDP-glucose 4,6-dehydratase
MSNILVIGSNSFSGSTFVDYALSNNFNVIGTSRSNEPDRVFLPYKWRNHENFKFHLLDINKHLSELVDLIHEKKPSYIVNFASQSMVAESWENPGDWFLTNAVSTIKLHHSIRAFDFIKRYVHISTPEVYGSCDGFVKENHPFNPSTPYAVSRTAADMSLKTFFSTYNFPVVTTRAANVYGPGQQLYRIIPRAILFILLGRRLQLHGGGVSTRSFIHMKDVCEATWKIMCNGQNGQTYHIATNQTISIRDLVEKICEKLDVTLDDCVDFVGDRTGKDLAYHLDSGKVRNELEWSDKVSLDQGLDSCIDWVRANLDVIKCQSFNYKHKP